MFSVCSFTVEDGAAATDLLLADGMAEAGGACGFVKDGPGTMSVAGEVKLGGFITVYDGTLDFSKAALAPGVRVNVLGDAKLIPPVSGTPISEIYVNGTKLKPGLWGAPGSVAAGKATYESPVLGGMAKLPDTGPSRREIWKGLKYGIFSHYVWNGYGMTGGPKEDGTRPDTIDEMAEVLRCGKLRRSIDRGGGAIRRVHRLAFRHLPDVSQRRDGEVGARQAELPEA